MLVVLTALALPAAAQARPALSLAKADRAAHRAFAQNVARFNQEIADAVIPEPALEPPIVNYRVYPCDLESRYRASCDSTYSYADGVSCDESLEVISSDPSGHHERTAIRWFSGDSEDCYPTS